MFIDWSDSSVSHPFFSAVRLIDEEPAWREQLRNAYLSRWTAFAPREELEAAYTLAEVCGWLQHALLYHQTILPNIETKWEMEELVPHFLKKMLACLDGRSR